MNQTRIVQWRDDVRMLNCSQREQSWLAEQGSLSVRLAACASQFRVQTLEHGSGQIPVDLRAPVQLTCPIAARRSVLLRCDEMPVVFGYTVWNPHRVKADWPFLSQHRLGAGPLGGKLFADRKTSRMPLQFARLTQQHALVRHMQRLLNVSGVLPQESRAISAADCYYARRSVFRRGEGRILVTEIFFPAVRQLAIVRRQPTLARLMGGDRDER